MDVRLSISDIERSIDELKAQESARDVVDRVLEARLMELTARITVLEEILREQHITIAAQSGAVPGCFGPFDLGHFGTGLDSALYFT